MVGGTDRRRESGRDRRRERNYNLTLTLTLILTLGPSYLGVMGRVDEVKVGVGTKSVEACLRLAHNELAIVHHNSGFGLCLHLGLAS